MVIYHWWHSGAGAEMNPVTNCTQVISGIHFRHCNSGGGKSGQKQHIYASFGAAQIFLLHPTPCHPFSLIGCRQLDGLTGHQQSLAYVQMH